MAKRIIDFGDYEEPTWEEYTGEDPPPNKWFNAQATRLKYDKEEDQLVCIFEITDGDYKGWGRGWYAPFEGEQRWKLHVLFKALTGATKNVSLDVDNEKALAAFLAKAKPVKIKTREYNDRISLNRLAPMLEAVPATGKGTTKAAEAELPGDTDAGDEPMDDYTEEELAEMEVGDLEEILVEEFELPKDDADFPKKSRRDRSGAAYKKALVDAILAEQEADEDGEDSDDAADGEDSDFEDGFDQDPEPEPEPEPAPRTRRSRAAKAEPAPAAKPATSTRRRRS